MKNDLIIYDYDGNPVWYLNEFLLNKQDCWENLNKIKEVHAFRLLLYSIIEENDDFRLLKECAKDLELCEFELQELWKFPKDAKFHRFWKTPKCKCPKLDNEELYGTGLCIIVHGCPLHGD